MIDIPLGTTERSKRPDGKLNVWQWRYLYKRDSLPRWVLIDVVKP